MLSGRLDEIEPGRDEQEIRKEKNRHQARRGNMDCMGKVYTESLRVNIFERHHDRG